jgi:energy-coupling factor transport system permease protein
VLDPRTKLTIAIFYAVFVVASGFLLELAAAWGILVLFIIWVRKGREYLVWLRLVVPMSLFFGAVTWWSANMTLGAVAAIKLLALTTVFFVFFSTTTPEDLGNAMIKIGVPYAIAFVLSTSLQFVPIIGRKAKNVMDAQRARGISLRPGWSALRHYPALLVPLLIQAFQLAEELAEAMESRGFGRPGRTFLHDYRLNIIDWLTMTIGFFLMTLCLFWV